MTLRIKRRLVVLSSIMAVVAVSLVYYVRTHPYVFNESFLGHSHCMLASGMTLMQYSEEHGGRFPYHTNGYGDALLLLTNCWLPALTGPGYGTLRLEQALRSGEDAPESEFGRVYVQGLSKTNAANIALLFDKLPTPGGDHCHAFQRMFAPLAREVWTIGGNKKVIQESRWPAYARTQIDLLVAAGVDRQLAEMYYSEQAKR